MAVIEQLFTDVGPTIKRYRESRRLSQSRLAEQCDFDHSYISRLESGARFPTRDALDRISLALGLGPEDDRELLHAGGFLSAAERTPDEFDELRSMLRDPAIRPDVREGIRLMLGGALSMLRTEREVLASRTGGGTVVHTEHRNGQHIVTVEQPLPGEPTL